MSANLKASNLLSSGSQALLAKLVADPSANPTVYNAWKYLCLCFDTPRPSSHEGKMRDRIIEIANTLKFDYAVDAAGNIRVRKPATPGFEDRVKICVQSHVDMVCSKTTDSTHDFHTMGVTVDVTEDGEWIKAQGTTLGADDGAGVAACLALLEESSSFQHGPLECLFTVEEETTMDGAINLAKAPFIEAQALINVDSEEDHSVCVGCAGGAETKVFLPVTREAAFGPVVNIEVSGLAGGHTGCDIHTDRGNAIRFAARIARHVLEHVPSARVVALSGGNAANAIPRDARVAMMVAEEHKSQLHAAAQAAFDELVDEYCMQEAKARIGAGGAGGYGGVDEAEEAAKAAQLAALTPASAKASSTIKLAFNDSTGAPLDKASSERAVALVLTLPHGVIRYSPVVEGDVETSNAVSLVGLAATPEAPAPAAAAHGRHGHCEESGPDVDHMWVHCFYRSFAEKQLRLVDERIRDIATLAGAYTTKSFGYFNGWEPITASPLFTATMEAHRTLFPQYKPPRVYSVHAGLECGPIKNQYPDIHAVSIGPTIVGAHSPDEQMKIHSMGPFMQWLKEIIAKLSAVKAVDFKQ